MAPLFYNSGSYINEIEKKSYPMGTPSKGYDANGMKIPYQSSFLNANPESSVAPPAYVPPASNPPVVNPPANNPPVTQPTRSKFINPATGEYFKTAEEYGNYVATKIPVSGDIPKYASDAITNPDQTSTQLESTARNLNNARNDLAVGETSMFTGSDKTATGEQIIYSPAEKDAIRKASAGVYDPALNDVFAKLKDKKTKEDAAAKDEQNRKDAQYQAQLDIQKYWATTGSKTSSDDVLSVNDAQALGVPYGTTKSQAATMGITPSDLTSSTKTMIEAAPNVKMFVTKLQKEISDAQKGLGPAVSRWRDFTAGKIGLDDPAFTQIKTNIGLMTTLLMRMHVGARGGEYIMKHFQDLVDSSKQSPANLLAALNEISDYTDSVIAEGKSGDMSGGSTSSVTADERAYLKSQGIADAEIDKLQ